MIAETTEVATTSALDMFMFVGLLVPMMLFVWGCVLLGGYTLYKVIKGEWL